jgi:hypothetical protein
MRCFNVEAINSQVAVDENDFKNGLQNNITSFVPDRRLHVGRLCRGMLDSTANDSERSNGTGTGYGLGIKSVSGGPWPRCSDGAQG